VAIIQRERREDLLVERAQAKDAPGCLAGQREQHGPDRLARNADGLPIRLRRASTWLARAKSGLNLDTKLTRTCLEFLVGELTDFVLPTIDLGQWLVVGLQIKRDRRALKMSETLTPPDGMYGHNSSCTQSEATD
jgi:hypothetical protein